MILSRKNNMHACLTILEIVGHHYFIIKLSFEWWIKASLSSLKLILETLFVVHISFQHYCITFSDLTIERRAPKAHRPCDYILSCWWCTFRLSPFTKSNLLKHLLENKFLLVDIEGFGGWKLRFLHANIYTKTLLKYIRVIWHQYK